MDSESAIVARQKSDRRIVSQCPLEPAGFFAHQPAGHECAICQSGLR